MYQQLLRRKIAFTTIVLLLGYTYLHTKLTGVFIDTDLSSMSQLSIRLPFAQRLLVPLMAHGLLKIIPLNVDEIFFLLEWLFVSLFFFTLRALLSTSFNQKQAQLLSWLFILLLPLLSVVNYRYTISGVATFFYPYDSASLFFMTAGLLLCLQSRWALFMPLLFLATLNRESSVLLVLLIPVLYWREPARMIWPLIVGILIYTLAHCLIMYYLSDLPGQYAEWCPHNSLFSHVRINLTWLFDNQNILFFAFCFAGLPLFWFTFYDYIPLQLRPIRYLTLFYFLILLQVGSFPEIRIFNEIIILLYYPICLAIKHWLSGDEEYPQGSGILYYIDRYAIIAALSFICVFRQQLYPIVHWLTGCV